MIIIIIVIKTRIFLFYSKTMRSVYYNNYKDVVFFFPRLSTQEIISRALHHNLNGRIVKI